MYVFLALPQGTFPDLAFGILGPFRPPPTLDRGFKAEVISQEPSSSA
jgi:hypothetical protein